ncbi:MAG: hypothetical protein H6Q73_2069 [Firmicutes bacterium]|nr:hypothetical protein [Bacillota bacterium]
MGQRFGFSFVLIVFITALILFFNLGGIALTDPDETVYAETAREMIQFNDYLSPRIYGEFWYDKPPMYYWLTAGSFHLFGDGEFAARFPSALLGVFCVLYVYFAGARLFNERAGLAGALTLATSIEFFYLGKGAVTDMTLNLFLTVALLAFIERKYYLLYVFAALATVTKGPIGLVFPGVIIFLYLAMTRNFSSLLKMKLPIGIIIYAVIAVPWYALMYQHHGTVFIDTFLGFHNLTRFTTPEHPETSAWFFFVPILLVGFVPWTSVMIQAIWRALTEGNQYRRPLAFLMIWAAFVFIFFSVSQTKLVSYILPMFPPLAMIVGWYLDRIWDLKRGSRPFTWPVLLTVFGALLSFALVSLAKSMPDVMQGAVAAALVFTVMIIGVWHAIFRWNIGRAFWIQVLGMAVFSIILITLLLPQASPMLQSREVAKEFVSQYDGNSPVYVEKQLHPGFAYYSGCYGTEIKVGELKTVIDANKRAYFAVRHSEYKLLNEADKQKVTTLAEFGDKMLLLKP